MKRCWLLFLCVSGALPGFSQDRLKASPAYEHYARMIEQGTNAIRLGALAVDWKDGGKAFEYSKDGQRFRYDIGLHQASEIVSEKTTSAAKGERDRSWRRSRPARGRQYASAVSPDGKFEAIYRDRNLWLKDSSATNEIAITTEGCEDKRIKYGSASWTYGEELEQNTAIWWSSNSQKVAFYRFDESKVPDYFLTLKSTSIQDRLAVEPYPKAGGTNPVVDVLIYDLGTKQTIRVDVRDGKPFTDEVMGHYVYGISWSADNSELLLHRTNRRQNVMELCAANPETGGCRVIIREEWLPSWVENSPAMRFLEDGRRFIWGSERTGWKNFYLYDISGELLGTLTDHCFEVADIVRVDESTGTLYYTVRSGDNPMKLQLHRVSLEGKGDRRLTDPAFHHAVDVSPDCRHFIDVAQTHDCPPVTCLRDVDGNELAVLDTSDLTKFKKLGLRPVELFEFKAADGQTPLYGMLHFPSKFNRRKQYPLLVEVYAGPDSVAARETFTMPNAAYGVGLSLCPVDARSSRGRGKRLLDSVYLNLGKVEIDDQAAGVKSLWERGYVDRHRVGIFGTSYGGTASALCLFRYPEVFQAACASSAVTDFRNYDTIYTERYFWLPQAAPEVYDQVRLMTYATNMQGRLMLFFGTADDNVHPANTLQLVSELQRLGKSFELQVGPDAGHASLNRERMMEFFMAALPRIGRRGGGLMP